MPRKTVLPQALSPEQQRALSVFMNSLAEYDALSLVTIPRSVLPTDFRCILKGKIPKNALVCDEHWSWNQSNAKIRTVTDNGLEIIIQKLNPRKKPETTLKRPSYKIWILAFRKTTDVADPELFVWCEKGLQEHGERHSSQAMSHVPARKSVSFAHTGSFSAALLDAMDIDTPAEEDPTDRFLRQMRQEGQAPKAAAKAPMQPTRNLHYSQPQPQAQQSTYAPSHARHQSLGTPASASMIKVEAKRSRSLSNPVCTTKLPPLFQDPSWDEGDEVMMDYVTSEEPSYCSAALTSVVQQELVVTMADLAFLHDFVVPQENHTPAFGAQRQW